MDKKKLIYLIGAGVAALAVIILIISIVFSGKGRDYDEYYDAAESDFRAGKYEDAIDKLEKAMDIESTEECYLLMAECYYADGDIDMAIQVLYLGYSRVGGDIIADRLEEFKAENKGNSKPDDDTVQTTPNGSLTIGGKEIDPDTKSLILSGKSLTDADIAGLAGLKELESLSLADNALTDISCLKGLTKLSFLQINGNSITDLSPLAGLTELKTLYIDGNPVEDFTALHGLGALRTLSMKGVNILESQMEALQEALPNCKIYADTIEEEVEEITLGGKTFMSDVTELDLRGLGITDISELSKCTELVHLDLRDNNVKDISPLVDLLKLEYLNLWNNSVEDLTPLMSLVNLEYLDADNNKIKNIAVLEYLPKMEELWLSGNELDSVKVLEKLTALRRLGLKKAGIDDKDLEMLGRMKTLTEITLNGNEDITGNGIDALKEALPNCKISHDEDLIYTIKLGSTEFKSDATTLTASGMGISDIKGLEKFTKLQTLVLSSNSISDISALGKCVNLEVLDLYANHISNISALAGLTKLRDLSLMNNSVGDISALRGLTNLTALHLSFNSISDLSPLAGMAAMKSLNLDSNSISDVSALAGLKALESLSLENNRIGDISALAGLTNLKEVYLRGNPDISIEEVYALQQALPGCLIVSDHDLTGYPPEETPAPEESPTPEGEGDKLNPID